MKKLLEVKEFERITGNVDYKNDSSYKYLEQPAFDDLVKFIEEFVASDQNDDAYDCLKIMRQRGVGEIVTAKNYVGLIQMKNGYQVQILPKISMGSADDTNNKTTKTTFVNMLKCMQDFQSKVFSMANLNIDKMNLYEIFISIYVQEVTNLVRAGLKSYYVAEEENLLTLKGRLDIQRNIVLNIAHKEKFYCKYDEYNVDRAENRIIKSTLLKLHSIAQTTTNRKNIAHLLSMFEYVSLSANYELDFSKINLDRSMKNYQTVIKWSKIFLKNKSFTTFSGTSSSRALLFPMDKLFESYVAKKMKKQFANLDWKITAQDSGYYLFDSPQQFKIRPDIVITQSDGTKILLDTKWKVLCNNPRKNYGISQADMYQMYAYAKKYRTNKIYLLYPINEEMKNCNDLMFQSKDDFGNIEVNVRIFFVDVTNIEVSLKKLQAMIVSS